MTIEERAMNYATIQCKGCRNEEKKGRYQGYIAGATEQKAIGINKACDEYCNHCPCYHDAIKGYPNGCNKQGCDVIRQFRKAMEE